MKNKNILISGARLTAIAVSPTPLLGGVTAIFLATLFDVMHATISPPRTTRR